MATKVNTTSEADRAQVRIAEEQRAEQIAEAFADRVTASLDDTSHVFKRARLIAEALRKGSSVRKLAVEVTRRRVMSTLGLDALEAGAYVEAIEAGSDATDEQKMLVKRMRTLKLSISKTTLADYAGAWKLVQESGLTPDAELVGIAYTACATTGTAKLRSHAIEVSTAAESDARRELFISTLREGLNEHGAVKTSKGQGSRDPLQVSSGDGVEVEGAPAGVGVEVSGVPDMSAEQAVAIVREISQRHWGAGDRESILAALEAATAALVGELELV